MDHRTSRRRLVAGGLGLGMLGSASAVARPQRAAASTGAPVPPLLESRATRLRPTASECMVYITNETDASLTLTGTDLEYGEFTPDWRPPAVIPAGQRGAFQGEGDLFGVATTGSEGRVRYNIDAADGGELYIHWNSPLIESDYDNTFHIRAPAGWEVSHSGGQGHRAELQIRLRRTALRSVPNFHPNGRGFLFSNRWDASLPGISLGLIWNKLVDLEPVGLSELGIVTRLDTDFGPITHADAGFCGGMVFAAMDYHANHLLPPAVEKSPTSSNDPLFLFIQSRLWDSFDVFGQGHRFLGYSSPHYPNGDSGVIQAVGLARGRSWVTYREATPQIMADIDAGQLSPVGLIQTDSLDIGKNHTVLAYACEKSGQQVTLYIADPNDADDLDQRESTFTFDVTKTDGEVHITRSYDQEKRIWAFFRINNYLPQVPPGGRRITSPRDAVRATTGQQPPYSVRAAMEANGGGPSVVEWINSL